MWALIGKKPCFYNCMENMERYTPSHTPSWSNGMENLHFHKEGYLHILVFHASFYKLYFLTFLLRRLFIIKYLSSQAGLESFWSPVQKPVPVYDDVHSSKNIIINRTIYIDQDTK